MSTLNVLYRDVDRMPYLLTLRQCAADRGLTLNLVRSSPAYPGWAERLEGGDVDVIAENYWGLQTYRARGSPFVTLASVVSRMTEMLVADASVRTVDDLRGKRLAVRGGGPQLFLPALWLTDQGLMGEVEQVVIPDEEVGRWGHWTKVADGTCQACFMAYLYADQALAAGLHEVPTEPYYFEGMNVTLTTTERLVEERRADLQALVDATFDATRVFKTDPATVLAIMRGECRELLAEHFDVSADAQIVRLYEILRDELADVPVPTLAGVRNALRIVRGEPAGRPQRGSAHYEDNVVPESFNPLLMWDLSFARAAQRARGQ
ncbi:MAG TPA: ABC transporter substrate-binding protein [Chloroflexota bacterium]|nr:ABC transporter substrate-binding protein [Chloroflexota bacterium]